MVTTTTSDGTDTPLWTQLVETFETATFPIRGPGDLLSVLADGRSVFVVDGTELSAFELALTAGERLSFPYETVDELVDDMVAAPRASDWD